MASLKYRPQKWRKFIIFAYLKALHADSHRGRADNCNRPYSLHILRQMANGSGRSDWSFVSRTCRWVHLPFTFLTTIFFKILFSKTFHLHGLPQKVDGLPCWWVSSAISLTSQPKKNELFGSGLWTFASAWEYPWAWRLAVFYWSKWLSSSRMLRINSHAALVRQNT